VRGGEVFFDELLETVFVLRVGSVACVACGGIRASLVDRPIKTGDRQTEYGTEDGLRCWIIQLSIISTLHFVTRLRLLV